MSIENELNDIKEKIEKIKTRKIELGSSIKILDKDKTQLLDECKNLGVDPKKLADEILKLEAELNKETLSLKTQLDAIDV